MADIARRALEELQELRSKGALTIDECKVVLSDDAFALPVLRELEDRYRREETGAGNDEAGEFLEAVGGAAAEPEPDDILNSSAPTVAEDLAQSPQWRLHRLAAHNYRGLTEWEVGEFEWDFEGKPCHIYGLNGSGKTGILSAIVWCLTGACLQERSEPGESICPVALYGTGDDRIRADWPEVVTVPHGLSRQELEELQPHCWVEVELRADNRRVWVRRIVSEGDGSLGTVIHENGTEYGSLDQIGISDMDCETMLLMPARVSTLQFGAGSKFSDNLLAVSGLDALRGMGDLAKRMAATTSRVSNKWRDDAEGEVKRATAVVVDATSPEKIADEVQKVLREVPEATKKGHAETDAAHYVRLYRAQAEAIGK